MCHTGAPLGEGAGDDIRQEDMRIELPDGVVMSVSTAWPRSGSGSPVLVVGDMYGRSYFYEELSRRLAAHGFVAICPDFFVRQGSLEEQTPEAARERWGRMDEVAVLADLAAVVEAVRGREGVTQGRIGTMGFCLGGTLVLNLAARWPDAATVCYYGFPAGSAVARRPAPPPLTEVGALSGDILGFWGLEDSAVGMATVDRYVTDVRHRGLGFDCVRYPGAGHGFMAAAGRAPDDRQAQDRAADAWSRTLGFLDEHLVAA
jgi:carboxymethylenebutenolidase